MLTIQTNLINLVDTYVSFVVADRQGRRLGAEVLTWEVDFAQAPETAEWGYEAIPPGHYFAFRPQATRNRQPYGASQLPRFFSTATRRDTAVAAYLSQARRRCQGR